MAAERVLRIAIDSAWNAPQIVFQHGQPHGGLFIELFEQIARNSDAKIAWVILPRKRLVGAVENNEADLLCHLNPKWLNLSIPPDRWSGLFITQENVIIQAAQHPQHEINLEQASFLNLGTVLGYHYPKLAAQIQRGLIRRIDSPSQEVLLKNTQNGKLQHSIANRLNVEEFNRRSPSGQQLRIVQTVDIQDTFCLLAPQPNIPAAQLKAAISQLHSAKQIDAILHRYHAQP